MGPIVGCYEYCNEYSDSIKAGEVLDQPREQSFSRMVLLLGIC
jgi:hypothetical protein